MKTMAMAAPGNLRCGITDYAGFLGKALQADWHLVDIELPAGSEPKAWQQAAAQADPADLVLVHYEYGLFRSVKPYRNLFARFMKRLRPPAIVILHDLLPALTPRRGEHDRFRLRDALRDLAYLPFFATWSSKIYGMADHFIVHAPQLYHGVRSTAPRAGVSFLRHPIPATSRQWRFGQPRMHTFISPGFIKPHKGYLDFIEVVPSRPHWNWLIAGGPQNDKDRQFADLLRSRIGELGLTDRVTISGYRSRAELEEMMTLAELAVFPYQQVTGSGAVAWAVGMGMPVAVTDQDAFRELRQTGCGLALLPGGKPDQWPDLVGSLLDDRERLQRLARTNTRFSSLNGYDATARHITAIAETILQQAEHIGRDS